jgi:hypothetical protein
MDIILPVLHKVTVTPLSDADVTIIVPLELDYIALGVQGALTIM